jgi:hypothetical protein
MLLGAELFHEPVEKLLTLEERRGPMGSSRRWSESLVILVVFPIDRGSA